MERYGGGSIVVPEYDPAWPAMFESERARLLPIFVPLLVTGIEHMASTAVPGLAAKPIIDLLVGVRSLAEAEATCIAPLEALGYTYVTAYEAWLPGELFFRRGLRGPWTHHVHVMEPANPRRQEFLLFRDYLRAHPEAAKAYGDLKTALAQAFGEDIAGYRDGKHSFVLSVLAKARAEQGSKDDAGSP